MVNLWFFRIILFLTKGANEMKKILQKAIDASQFEVSIFGGQLSLQGRILSPAEAYSAGVASSLIAAEIATDRTSKEIKRLKDKDPDDLEEGEVNQLLKLFKRIKPETLENLSEQQNKIICKVIRFASDDEGSTWSPIHLVMNQGQQNADQSRLWVGIIGQEDRQKILDHALQGHKEASEKLATFRG